MNAQAKSTNWALFALAVAAFGIGTTEFVIMGLLPEVAGDLAVSIPKAGLLISAYALGVAFGGPFLALGAAKLPRKAMLIGLMGVFVLGNMGCALAPNYELLMVARIVTSFCHAAFFGIGAVVAADLVPREKRAQAMALMFSGLTIANVLGVPFGTILGQAAGWRATFWAVTGIGLLAMAALAFWVPSHIEGSKHGLAQEMRALKVPQVWVGLATSVMASISMFVLFTYIAPFLREVTGIAPHRVGGVLLLFGIGITIGNFAGARLADWRLMPSLMAIFLLTALALAVFTVTGSHPLPAIVTLFLWGGLIFAACTSLQARVIDRAGAGADLASTLNIGAFNLGNAIGAGLGGLVIAHGFALVDLAWVGSAAALVALGMTVFSASLDRRDAAGAVPAAVSIEVNLG